MERTPHFMSIDNILQTSDSYTEFSRLILGIDTGGTYTDAALCREDLKGLTLISSAKARTTKENLTIGIREAVAKLDPALLPQVCRVSLSTTLATNACVEGIGGEVYLVLIDKAPLHDKTIYTAYGLPDPAHIIFLQGNISTEGIILERPSQTEILASLKLICKPGVSIAVSGIFSTRNPELELEVAGIARQLGANVICGRDVAPNQLNYLRRAATALLNCRLQPVIRDFLESVSTAMKELHLNAPIDIVRSDGSLMNHKFALEYPVETLLCGPAASVSGVISLLQGNQDDYVIADIGGTTTDLSLVRRGQAVRTPDGVNIGSYRTSVQSVFVETLGLGGDTRLYLGSDGHLALDTRRAVPLCVLSAEYPHIKQELLALAEENYLPKRKAQVYEFLTLSRQPSSEEYAVMSTDEQIICDLLMKRPQSMRLCAAALGKDLYTFKMDRLENNGLIRRAALTLTDILHLEGSFTEFDEEASRIAAGYFMSFLDIDETEFIRRSRELADFRLYRAISLMCIRRDIPKLKKEDEAGMEKMIAAAFYGGDLIQPAFRLPVALVGVGAAAQSLIGNVGNRLSATVILPDGAPVTNAIGAAASSVRAEICRDIRRCEIDMQEEFQVCGGETTLSFTEYEDALAEARRQAEEAVIRLARDRGILGTLKIEITDQRNILETQTQLGKLSFDFGGRVIAVAEAETSELLSGI